MKHCTRKYSMHKFQFWFRKFVAPGLGILTGRSRFYLYRKIKDRDWLSTEEISKIQMKELRNLIVRAKEEVPFYRNLLTGYVIPEGRELIDLLHSLPVLSKKDIQKHFKEIVSDKCKSEKTITSYTGGSTGNPLKLLHDTLSLEKKEAAFMRSLTWGGWEIGEPIAMFWGGLQEFKKRQSIMARFKRTLTGVHRIRCYEYDDDLIRHWLVYLKDKGIKYIYGYASVLFNIACYQKKHGMKLSEIRSIFSTAETLIPEFRETIEDAFQCKVYDQYGSREVVNIAAECECGNMHVLSDMVYAEFFPENGSQGNHKIVLTSFTNYIMPFIRYDIEDWACPKSGVCSCGRRFPLMEIRIGRKNDHFRKPNGQILYPSYFIHLLDGIEGIASFQFKQIESNKIILYITKNSAYGRNSNRLLSCFEEKIQKELNWDVNLEIKEMEKIPVTDSGKHRHVISEFGESGNYIR